MSNWTKWYNKVASKPGDIDTILGACIYFEDEICEAFKELKSDDQKIEKFILEMPSMIAYRTNQFKEIEGILKLLESREKDLSFKWFKYYTEGYPRTLTPATAEKYASAEPEVSQMREIRLRVALVSNQFQGIIDGLNAANYRIGDVVKLRLMGIEESTL